MIAKLLGLFGFSASAVIVALGVCAIFWKADDALSDRLRRDVSNVLLRLSVSDQHTNWPTAFLAMFDRIFDKKHLSWKCFYRSCITSTVVYFLCVTLFLLLNPENAARTVLNSSAFFLAFGFVINFAVDYLSLLETRFILGRLKGSFSHLRTAILVLLDFLMTHVIIGMVMSAFLALNAGLPIFRDFIYAVFVGIIGADDLPIELRSEGAIPLLFMYLTTLTTSIWVWLSAIGWSATREATRLNWALRRLRYALPVETYPMRSIGVASGTLLLLGFGIAGLLGST